MKKLLLQSVNPGITTRGTDLGLLVLRVMSGSMMLFAHGWGKIVSYPEKVSSWANPIGLGSEVTLTLAVLAEFFCSLAIIFGVGTRLAAIPLLCTMLVAALIVHVDDPWQKQEFALLYATIFLGLIFTGAGRFSFDGALFKRLSLQEAAESL